jgi:hypothetical protein
MFLSLKSERYKIPVELANAFSSPQRFLEVSVLQCLARLFAIDAAAAAAADASLTGHCRARHSLAPRASRLCQPSAVAHGRSFPLH